MGLWDDLTGGYSDPQPLGGMLGNLWSMLGEGPTQTTQATAMPPSVGSYLGDVVSGRRLMQSLNDTLGGQNYDPNKSFAENATNPAALDQATNLALGFAGGGMATKEATHAPEFLQQLRDTHLAQDNPLPFAGKSAPEKAAVAPPPHIQTMDDFNGLVQRYVDLAKQGMPWRDWYQRSGQAMLYNAGDNPDTASKLMQGTARLSAGTPVESNLTSGLTIHSQAMLGEPELRAGRFPNAMGPDIERYYYGDEPISGEKIGAFNAGVAKEWDPNVQHPYVNDRWNMRALEYADPDGGVYSGTPSGGQHNFARIVGDRARQLLEDQTGTPWTPEQTQAAAWTAVKARAEGTSLAQAGKDFSDAFQKNYGQLSWESAPGHESGDLHGYFDATPEQQQEYHDAIKAELLDDKGRDIIPQHFGLLTGGAFDAPGAFEGRVSPGTQSQVALGQGKGGWQAGVDPASRQLATASEVTRALLLRQTGAAWTKPTYMGGPGLTGAKGVGLANMVDVDMGRVLTRDEAQQLYQGMTDRMTEHGASMPDFFSPIGTPNGFRFYNVPEATGVENADFQRIARDVMSDNIPDATGHVHDAHADGDYVGNNWQENPNGEDYRSWLRATGSSHIQRASQELLATLGPRIAKVQDDFAQRYGWTPNRATRVWETDPEIAQLAGQAQPPVIPSPPKPWANPPPGWLARQAQPPAGLITPNQ